MCAGLTTSCSPFMAALNGDMSNLDILNDRRDCNIIKSIRFETNFNDEHFSCSLNIELCSDDHTPEDSIHIMCLGVSDLRIEELGGGVSQLGHLIVDDIRDRQWDRLNYHVYELENEVISFYCRDVVCK